MINVFIAYLCKMSDSLFIVMEGLDGSGKSTAARRLVDLLETQHKVKVTLSHEPNRNYCGGDYIRDVLEKKITEFHPRVLPLSFAANRLDHCERLINPLLKKSGNIIISDRYYLSSLVYQSSPDFPFESVMALNEKATQPHIIFFLNASNSVCYERMNTRNQTEELFESRLEEHRTKYLQAIDFLSTEKQDNIIEIDGNGTVEQTVEQMMNHLSEFQISKNKFQ